jgi:hypothetical protein
MKKLTIVFLFLSLFITLLFFQSSIAFTNQNETILDIKEKIINAENVSQNQINVIIPKYLCKNFTQPNLRRFKFALVLENKEPEKYAIPLSSIYRANNENNYLAINISMLQTLSGNEILLSELQSENYSIDIHGKHLNLRTQPFLIYNPSEVNCNLKHLTSQCNLKDLSDLGLDTKNFILSSECKTSSSFKTSVSKLLNKEIGTIFCFLAKTCGTVEKPKSFLCTCVPPAQEDPTTGFCKCSNPKLIYDPDNESIGICETKCDEGEVYDPFNDECVSNLPNSICLPEQVSINSKPCQCADGAQLSDFNGACFCAAGFTYTTKGCTENKLCQQNEKAVENKCNCIEPAFVNEIGLCDCESGQIYTDNNGCINPEIPICKNGQKATKENLCICANGAAFNENTICFCLVGKNYSENGCSP